MMFRRLFAAVLAAGLLLLIGAPAYAQPPVTTTNTEKNLVETFIDVVPSCEGGPPYTVTTTSNLVEHETVFADGRVHATFTQTGTAVGVPLDDPSLPTYTAKFTVWGNFNTNGQTVNGTFTFNVHGTLLDGSTFSNHVNDHFNVRPDGTVNEFFHCHD
jgi:hypothetical protein